MRETSQHRLEHEVDAREDEGRYAADRVDALMPVLLGVSSRAEPSHVNLWALDLCQGK